MKHYEVKAWVRVEAEDEDDAIKKASDLLDQLPDGLAEQTSIEGEGAVYEVEED